MPRHVLTPAAMCAACHCVAQGPEYEDGPGALLAGSFISLLLLSNKPQIFTLGFSIGFTASRYALATTQTTDYTTCMGNSNTGLKKLLGDTANPKYIPQFIGPLGGRIQGSPAFTYGPQVNAADFPLSEDGRRVLCASISMVVGGNTWAATPEEGFLLWQGVANANIAINKQVALSLGQAGITQQQALTLCAIGKATYSFTKAAYTQGKDWTFTGVPNSQPQTWVTSPVPATLTPVETNLVCLTQAPLSPFMCSLLPSWVSADRTPYLATDYDLSGPRLPNYCTAR